jgi:O-antigen/teichoic acid export membrane protein
VVEDTASACAIHELAQLMAINTRELIDHLVRVRPIIRTYFASTGTLMISLAAQFSTFILLARGLGPENFGKLMIITAVTSIGATVCGAGSADAMVRLVARDRSAYSSMLGHGLLLIVPTGLLLTVISASLLFFLVRVTASPGSNYAILLIFSLTNILLFYLASYAEQIYMAFQDFLRANIANIVFSLIRLLSAILAFVVFHTSSLTDWAFWTLAAHLLTVTSYAFVLRSAGKPVWKIDWQQIALGIHFCIPNVLEAVRTNVDRIVLGLFILPASLGSYAAATRMVQVSQVIVHALNRVMYPKFAQHKSDGLAAMRSLAIRYVIIVTLMALVTSAIVFLIAPWLPLIVGKAYYELPFDLRVLCWLIVPLAIITVPYDILGAFDHHAIRSRAYVWASIFGIALTVFLAYRFGLPGAFTAAYAQHLIFVWVYWRLLLRN